MHQDCRLVFVRSSVPTPLRPTIGHYSVCAERVVRQPARARQWRGRFAHCLGRPLIEWTLNDASHRHRVLECFVWTTTIGNMDTPFKGSIAGWIQCFALALSKDGTTLHAHDQGIQVVFCITSSPRTRRAETSGGVRTVVRRTWQPVGRLEEKATVWTPSAC